MLTVLGLIALFLPVLYVLSDGYRESSSRNNDLDEIQRRLEAKDSEKSLQAINSLRETPIFIGDLVKVVKTPATKAVGVSGMHGTVRRAATPSTAEIDPIGTRFSDAALFVYVEELDKYFWFYPDLVQHVDPDKH